MSRAAAAPVGTAARAPTWAGLLALGLSLGSASLGTSIANVSLPTIAQVFGATLPEVQWVVLAYLLAVTSLAVGAGRLGDLTGRKRLLLAGLGLFSAASIACSLSPSLWLLIAARAAQGIGAAAMMALTMALVTTTVPKERTGRAMGLLGTASAAGTALGPALGGILISAFGWQASFAVTALLGALTLAVAWHYLPPDPPRQQDRSSGFDVPGTILLAAALSALTLALTLGRGQYGLFNMVLGLAGGGAFALFLAVEAKASAPLLRLDLFRRPGLSAGFAMSLLVTAVVMATLVVGPFYLSGALHLEAAEVGLVMSAGPLTAALAGVPSGWLADRAGPSSATLTGLFALLAGSAAMALLAHSYSAPVYASALILLTAGYALFQAANNTAVMTGLAPEQRGVTSALLSLSRNLGLITGASAMGVIFASVKGASDTANAAPEHIAQGLQATFAAAGLLIAVSLAIAISERRAGRNAGAGA